MREIRPVLNFFSRTLETDSYNYLQLGEDYEGKIAIK